MRKLLYILSLILILYSFSFSACVYDPKIHSLEARIEQLETKKSKDIMLLAEGAGANKFWWRSGLTGGTGSDLDGISGAYLTNNDAAFVIKSGSTEILPYIFKSGTTNTEDGYTYINDDTGEGTWVLCVIGNSGVSSYAADGTHFIDVSNSANLTDIEEGRCWFARDVNKFYCGIGSGTTVLIGP